MEFSEVSIVGKGIGWEDAPNFGEVWGVNDIMLKKRSVTRIFSLHSWIVIGSHPSMLESLQVSSSKKIPFVCIEASEAHFMSETYPFKEISSFFSTEYFTNSICYMIAYALYYNIETLNFFGVNHKHELRHRAGVEYWIGRALGMGVAINIYGPSKLLTNENLLPYGYRRSKTNL